MTTTATPTTPAAHTTEAPFQGSGSPGRPSRKWMLKELHRLDPEKDAGRITELSYSARFSRMQLSYHMYYSMFFLRASGAPESARPIDRDGKGFFYRNGHKRADDTTADIFGWMHHGPESELGRASIARVKRMHDNLAARWGMPNHVLVHTLACDLLSPHWLMEMIGGPKFDDHERLAHLNFWRAVGDGLGITDVPETWDGMVAYVKEYEASEHFQPSPHGKRLAHGFADQFCERWFPRGFRWLGRWVLLSLVEDHVLDVHGFERPPRPVVRLTREATRLTAYLAYYVLRDPSPTFSPGELFRSGHPDIAACPVKHATPS
ncbi:MAG TPA: oxygenase MpaB family protein [Thermoleophilaceae bacterium]|jgi:hypothetical protein